MGNYYHNTCDLCGSDKAKVLIKMSSTLGMTSDSRVIKRNLHKLECEFCGMIRDGNDFLDAEAQQHYKNEYTLNNHEVFNEHIFYKDGVAIPRSVAIAKWMKSVIDTSIHQPLLKIYEIGTGQGNLLVQFQNMFPEAECSGCEVNQNAVDIAKNQGLSIVQGEYSAIHGKYDLIVSFGVLEHVESPYHFLSHLRNHLTDHGYLLIAQPMQDFGSYDMFFVDHLHHFHTKHIELFGRRAGFDQVMMSASPWFANNFSVHLLEKTKKDSDEQLKDFVYLPTQAHDSIIYWKKIFYELEMLSQEKGGQQKKYAIYGLGEMATLLYCYGGLNRLHIAIGIDDNPEKYKQNIFNIPVKKLDELSIEDKEQITAVLLTCNYRYYPYLTEKCRKNGLSTIEILK